MHERCVSIRYWPVAILLGIALAFSVNVHAQVVSVTIEATGDEVPGGTVTLTATVTTTDGSTVESYAWSQIGGAQAVLANETTEAVSVTLAAQSDFKDALFDVLAEPPITEAQLPPNVELPEGEFPAGIQDRFEITGVNPFALEEAGMVTIELTVVTTSSETWVGTEVIHVTLPWKPASGIANVAIGIPVLLHGKKDQTAYDWTLTAPGGSASALVDGTTQNPWFTPDVAGQYDITVTEEEGEGKAAVTISVYAGSWMGVIEGQDNNGRPVANSMCTTCHSGTFANWAETGHAEIFSDSLNTNDHYGEGCFSCHTVGYDPDADNGGIDEADDYDAFIASDLLPTTSPDNWTTMLADYPMAAQMANIQCENCHGPQDSSAHQRGAPRQSLSANVCATCHGEPARHARFQQWQLSAHANYEVAIDEGNNGSCAKCHTVNGFLAWQPILFDTSPGADPTGNPEVTWTTDEIHPQTCQTCHDPHKIGTDSGDDPVVTVRITGDTPLLMAGFTATDVGMGALCMTCHNSRRGLRNDDVFSTIYGTSDATRAPHGGTQTDVLMGQNAYNAEVGMRSFHSQVEDSCVACHMEATPPPDALSYNQGGTNHTFKASKEICQSCHTLYTAEDVQGPVAEQLDELQSGIEQALLDTIAALVDSGNSIDLGGEHTIDDAADITGVEFGETHGRQAITVYFADSTMTDEPIGFNSIDVVPATGDPYDLYSVTDPRVVKAGWNWLLFHNDGSLGVHNPMFAESALIESIDEVDAAIAEGGGGIGGSCSSKYWTEIAAHNEGVGSIWRTDLVARNASGAAANVELTLHTSTTSYTWPTMIDPMAQGVFEDIVGIMGVEDKGALQICSSQPLEVVSRIYNQSENGTFGQFVDGFPAMYGMSDGDSARLLGLRQETGVFRTNISVTNTGDTAAEVNIGLYATDGTEVYSYTLTVDPAQVVQDLEPFRKRAGRPNIGWAFAVVEVVSGSGVITSASVIDAVTADATTIPMKW